MGRREIGKGEKWDKFVNGRVSIHRIEDLEEDEFRYLGLGSEGGTVSQVWVSEGLSCQIFCGSKMLGLLALNYVGLRI